jgi:F0F1-type ATP synthase assembly protein I
MFKIHREMKDIFQKSRKEVYKIIYLQIITVIIAAILWFFFKGIHEFISALLGGVCWIIPSFYFIKKTFNIRRAQNDGLQLSHLAKKFFTAELLKLLFSALLIILCLKFLTIILWPFLSGYIIAIMSLWFMPLI